MINPRLDHINAMRANPNSVAQFRDVISRLVATLGEENRILDERQSYSLDIIVQRKSQLLLELMRAHKVMHPDVAKEFLRTDIKNLKLALVENQEKLAVHYAAAKDITEVILEVLRDNESDGTYANTSISRKLRQ